MNIFLFLYIVQITIVLVCLIYQTLDEAVVFRTRRFFYLNLIPLFFIYNMIKKLPKK